MSISISVPRKDPRTMRTSEMLRVLVRDEVSPPTPPDGGRAGQIYGRYREWIGRVEAELDARTAGVM